MSMVDPEVVQFLVEAGLRAEPTADGVQWSEGDHGIVVVPGSTGFTVMRWERGATGSPRLENAPGAAVAAYLLLEYGNAWRALHGLQRIPIRTPSTLPSGYRTTATVDGQHVFLSTPETSEAMTVLYPETAYELAFAMTYRTSELIASFRHPDGLPAFGPLRGGPR